MLLMDRGHVLLMSPKAHPELAGKGIEYTLGKFKREVRRLNDSIARNLLDSVVKTFQYVGEWACLVIRKEDERV